MYLMYTHFINIASSGSPCALEISQADIFYVNNTKFVNLNNSNQTKTVESNIISYYQGGAIGIQNVKQTHIEYSLFQNCSSSMQGGAIYSSQQIKANFILYKSNFIDNKSIYSSGGAIFLQFLRGVNITKSNFTKNKALFQNGGAISLDTCDLLQFSDDIFSSNEASIGGSIYHYKVNSNLIKKINLLQNNIIFWHNKASFYGQNIGSIPQNIGITNKPHLDSLKIVEEYSIYNISSGNYLDKKLYLNFIDEENNSFNFLGPDIFYDRSQFYFQLYIQNNSQIVIQEGMSALLNKTIGMFELNFQSFYKISQNQTISIISNQFQQGVFLSIPLHLYYRNCTIGEIILEKNQFIQCSQCVEGRYSLKIPDMQNNINKLECVSCPEQAHFCQGSEIQLKDGYWRESNLTDQIYTCLLDSCSFNNPQSKNGCLTGFVGPLCNSCDNKNKVWGQQYGLKGQNCFPCSQQLNQIAFACFFIIFYVFYIAFSQHNIIASKIRIMKLKIFKQIQLLVTSNLSSSANESSLLYKIFINYLQILSCIANFTILNTYFLSNPVNLFGNPIKITINSLDCLFKISDKYPLWLNRIIIQIFSIIIICLLTLILLLIKQLRSYKKKEQALKKFHQMIKMTLVFIYIFYQPSIVINQNLIFIGFQKIKFIYYSQKIENDFFIFKLNFNKFYYFIVQNTD
ncbi:transmembrane protein, putative (macronuclear) [Tetrahymena thermophila SB210]|uniref:Transmembrane protein, putative n=1 Tax=Tetrahymena thermophila (strain SB210) TaxID=312017 RepID=W7XL27_TETTS|nr:transmembrane protein, putative [Tetrahymena thermophila SB210]EWS75559.1 transmembrane protein, putative [Tetrahymena thermophila SB210]|eukprot:XP_012651903.1 transmembrane protein, putative [Tetrahymena thermophila SB210]